jgi:hypothetical protein
MAFSVGVRDTTQRIVRIAGFCCAGNGDPEPGSDQMILRLRRIFGLQKRRRRSLGLSEGSLDEVEETPGNQTAVGIISSGSQLHNFF